MAERSFRRQRGRLVGLGFLSPFFVPFVLFYIGPVVYAAVQSTEVTQRVGGIFGTEVTRFGGVTQYAAVLTSGDFWSSLSRVVLLAAVQVPVMGAVALLLALLLDSPRVKLGRFFRLAYFLPFAVPGVVAAIMWGTLLDPNTSPIYQAGLHVDFLGGSLVLPSIGNVASWTFAGSNAIIFLAALKAVPPQLFEAARIDGAGDLRIAWSIKIPLVRPTIIFTGILNMIGVLQLITEPMIFRTITSEVTSGYTPNMLAYNAASTNQYQYAAAVSVTLAVITFAASFGFLRLLQRRSEG
ncbi:sugar ABC transporter permease [Kribbella jejuensis]|uniref:Multiple sugar transport system permease protein n=1 Tax=Kribbella jejuensis TaxID=236068 RepID=A0A542ERQ1_9ACTN|nr:sugar ABC transporter permease [Kribbella jejuensis]TQJ18031.1 multiple sugar transport system permease protein [Kribbella jejuensis]